MIGSKIPRAHPGAVYRASDQNRIVDEVERQGRLGLGVGLAGGAGPFGAAINAPKPDRIFARITAINGSSRATWTEVISAAGGTWTTGVLSGSPTNDPAYEANGATTISGLPKIVEMERASNTGEWLFLAGLCT